MSYIKKPFEELDIIDDFLMNAVAADSEVGQLFCRKILTVLLQRKIGKIRIVTQRAIPAMTPSHRGIRMDVEVEELKDEEEDAQVVNVYDIEPHHKDSDFLPKRNRFYQAKIDSRYLKSGEDNFEKLPCLYIITITNYDPFDKGYMMYTIRNRCEEVCDLEYKDGLKFIYFNTKGKKGGNEAIRNLLSYIQDSRDKNVIDDTTREIHEYVNRVKVQPEVRLEYMRFDEIIAYERKDEKKDAILELLEEYGEIPVSVRERIDKEWSKDVLKRWLKLAAKASSMDEFEEQM